MYNLKLLFVYHFLWSGIIGVYPVKPQIPVYTPAVGGYEGVGEVHSLGSAVKGLSPGDLVIPCPPSFCTLSLVTSSTYHVSSVVFLFSVECIFHFFICCTMIFLRLLKFEIFATCSVICLGFAEEH